MSRESKKQVPGPTAHPLPDAEALAEAAALQFCKELFRRRTESTGEILYSNFSHGFMEVNVYARYYRNSKSCHTYRAFLWH